MITRCAVLYRYLISETCTKCVCRYIDRQTEQVAAICIIAITNPWIRATTLTLLLLLCHLARQRISV